MKILNRIILLLTLAVSAAPNSALALGKCDSVKEILTAPDSRAYRFDCIYGDNKLPFHDICPGNKDRRICPTGKYVDIHRGDYFIAVRDSGLYCAAFIPDGYMKPKAVGFVDLEGTVHDGSEFHHLEFREFGSADMGDMYDALYGKWISLKKGEKEILSFSFSGTQAYAYLDARMEQSGKNQPDTASVSDKKIVQAKVLRTGKTAFAAFAGDDIYEIALDENSENDIPRSSSTLTVRNPSDKNDADKNHNFSGKYLHIPCSAAGEVTFRDPHSYRAADKVKIYHFCAGKENSFCPDDSYIEKGDYFLAVPWNKGFYCAAYMPDGYQKPKDMGLIKAEGNYVVTPETDYNDLLGGWQPAEGLKFDFVEFYRTRNAVNFFNRAPVEMASRELPDGRLQYASVLKTGKSSYLTFGTRDRGWYGEQMWDGFHDIFLRKDILSINYTRPYDNSGDQFRSDNFFSKSGYKKSYSAVTDCAEADAVAAGMFSDGAHSYKALGKIAVLRPCLFGGGYCETGKFIKKGSYFIATKYDGTDAYCAAQIDESSGKRHVTVGHIKGGNFTETALTDYKPLRPDSLWKPRKAAAFTEHGYLTFSVSYNHFIQIGNNTFADMPDDEVDNSPDVLTERDIQGNILKIGSNSFIAVTYHGLYYISVKARGLTMRGIYSIDKGTDTGDAYNGNYIFNRMVK